MLTTYGKIRSGEAPDKMIDLKALRRFPFCSLMNFSSPSQYFRLIPALAFVTFLLHNLAFQMFPFKAAVWN